MGDDMDSDTSCVGSKRRISDMGEALLQRPRPPLSAPLSTQEDLKDSSFVLSSPKEAQEIPSPGSLKKVKCSFVASESGIGERTEVGFGDNEEVLVSVSEEKVTLGDLVSRSSGCEGTGADLVKKLENFGVEVQESRDCLVGFRSNGEQNKDEGEETVNGVKEEMEKKKVQDCVKSDIGCCGIGELANQEISGECKAAEVEMSSVIDEKKEILEVKVVKAESSLEAKKLQLLAEVERGSLFKCKAHVENLDICTNVGILKGLKGVDDSVRPSLKFEVIDDTALIEMIPVPNAGDGCVKVARGNRKKNEKQGSDGKKAKRPQRKGNVATKVLENSEMPEKITVVGEAGNDGRENEGAVKRKYSREEMEALRFLNIVEQRKMWREIYTGLGDAIVKEYKDLASSKHQKNVHLNFSPWERHGRKNDASGILRDISSENADNQSENFAEDEVENADSLDTACSCSIVSEDGCTVLEGEYSEEDDSDEDYASIQRPAFDVEGEPDFTSGPPEDGFEYLRRVRWEAAHIPQVKVAKLDRSKVNKEQSVYMPQIPDIAECPEHLLPLKQWEDAFLADFSKLRLFLSYDEGPSPDISQKKNTSSPQSIESIVLEKFDNFRIDNEHSHKPLDDLRLENTIRERSMANVEDDKIPTYSQNSTLKASVSGGSCNYPTLSTILSMDNVAQVSKLREHISLAETESTLSKNDCVWLFALCAAVDVPLDADTSAALRNLLRKCARLRANKSELDDEVIMLNILATIAGRYFGQSEK